ncbi:glycoside hydrolase, partial [candidate division KSB1 bacterium]|nr:glycoside hydrolase [candidate division KSB1 bacterium]
MKYHNKFSVFIFIVILLIAKNSRAQENVLKLNDQDYFEMPGLNVMLFHDNYPEGHQSGVTIIQHGIRVAANGDLRLEPTPGQWQPVPAVGERITDREKQVLSVPCSFPDPKRNRTGFNPIDYPDLELKYQVNVKAEGAVVRITVDLEEALPAEWIGKVGFNLEFFPGALFGKSYALDNSVDIFPQQLNGPMMRDQEGNFQIKPLAEGKTLVVAPEDELQRIRIESVNGVLQLIDGRAHHNNGWFIVRTPVPAGALKNAVEWVVTPHVIPGWKYEPVIQISQVGYHPNQKKMAIIECDPSDEMQGEVALDRIQSSGELETVLAQKPEEWGRFLRYQYFRFDFSDVKQEGMYQISYGDVKT